MVIMSADIWYSEPKRDTSKAWTVFQRAAALLDTSSLFLGGGNALFVVTVSMLPNYYS